MIYYSVINESLSNKGGISPSFISWIEEIVGDGDGLKEVGLFAQQLGELKDNFEVKYKGLLNMQIFEIHLLA